MDEFDEFDAAAQNEMMVNSLIRIAKDLERVIIGIYGCAGLLGLIALILIFRTMIGR